MKKITIKDLHVKVDDKEILKGINLEINAGEIVAIMGPNGNGKSTLLKVIMGHPRYQITKGDILIDNKSIKDKEPNERAKLGLFFAMQAPQEIPGVLNLDFLKAALNEKSEKKVEIFEFFKKVEQGIKDLKMPEDLTKRFVNEGFSGGEKKKNEILQLKIIGADFAMLDEIDSGLDVDALNTISQELNIFAKDQTKSLIIVSHYERLFKLIKPTKTFVLLNGKIVKTGGNEIVTKIDKEGYDWLKKEGLTSIAKSKK